MTKSSVNNLVTIRVAAVALLAVFALLTHFGGKPLFLTSIECSNQAVVSSLDEGTRDDTVAPLPSGWDEKGNSLYRNEKQRLAEALTTNPQAVYEHTVLPLGPVRTAHNWFRNAGFTGSGPGKWEHDTFVNFLHHISGCRYYVEFGAWIGPTLFFAAQLIDQAVSFDGDPLAVVALEMNLALNSDKYWARRARVHPHVVGEGSFYIVNATSLTMKSSSAGNSCSGLVEVANCGRKTTRVEWKVNAYTLPAVLKRLNIPETSDLFIKMDVESFECQLVPSWIEWIQSLEGPKPVFHMAFHSQIVSCSEEQYHLIYKFIKLFDNAPVKCFDEEKETWKCRTGEFVVYDNI